MRILTKFVRPLTEAQRLRLKEIHKSDSSVRIRMRSHAVYVPTENSVWVLDSCTYKKWQDTVCLAKIPIFSKHWTSLFFPVKVVTKTQALLPFIHTIVSIIKLRRDLALENLAIHQFAVYQHRHPRPQLRPRDRVFWSGFPKSGANGVQPW